MVHRAGWTGLGGPAEIGGSSPLWGDEGVKGGENLRVNMNQERLRDLN